MVGLCFAFPSMFVYNYVMWSLAARRAAGRTYRYIPVCVYLKVCSQSSDYRSWLRFRNSFVFTTRPPRDAAPSCRSCPSRPQGRRHMCQCARSAGSRWVPQSKRSLHCSARSHCGAAPRRRSMSGLQGQCFSAARGLRQGPGRPHGAPEAAGVASLMTCATRRRGQLRFHNALAPSC